MDSVCVLEQGMAAVKSLWHGRNKGSHDWTPKEGGSQVGKPGRRSKRETREREEIDRQRGKHAGKQTDS